MRKVSQLTQSGELYIDLIYINLAASSCRVFHFTAIELDPINQKKHYRHTMGSITESSTNLPIIDLSPFVSSTSTPESRLQCAKDLVQACHSTGFVYITNHGISPSLLSEAFSWGKEFFALSEEEKCQASHPPGSNIFRGYSKIGREMVPEMEGEKVKGVVDFNVWSGDDM